MKKFGTISLVVMLALSTLFLAGYSPAQAREPKILVFDTMVGNTTAFTGAKNPIRGINGGGLPWGISSGHGDLSANGHLLVVVRGLVFAAGPNAGANTVPSFRAIVSCLKSDGSVDNVMTAAFPATQGMASKGGGNAKIDTTVALPKPCIAPMIFITSPGGAWFAATGN